MGTLAINGLPLHKTRGRELAKQRAFLPQHSQLAFDYRVAQVVEMGVYPYSTAELGQPSASLVSQCLAQVGLESYGSRSYLSLSGGEQQRTHLARVLAQLTASGCPKGKLLILDEPTSSLDPRHQLYTLSLARKMADEGAGVIAVLHDAALAARFATHFLLLKGGVTITQGTFKEAFATEALSLLYDMPCRMVPDGLGGVCVRFG
jgi:iron complex transport system ATP-binding protein